MKIDYAKGFDNAVGSIMAERSLMKFRQGLRTRIPTRDVKGTPLAQPFLVSSYCAGKYTVITTPDEQWVGDTKDLPDGIGIQADAIANSPGRPFGAVINGAGKVTEWVE